MAQDDDKPAISEAWRDGMLLVVTPHSDLPTRCLKCNAEATAFRVSRKIPTLSAWYPLFSSAGWNAHCVDDRPVHVPFSLCTRHRLQWLARLSLIGLAAMANLFCFALYKTGRFPGPTIDALMTLLPLTLAAMSLTLRPPPPPAPRPPRLRLVRRRRAGLFRFAAGITRQKPLDSCEHRGLIEQFFVQHFDLFISEA